MLLKCLGRSSRKVGTCCIYTSCLSKQQHMDKTCWTPVELIEPSEHKNFNYALLVLNTRIALPKTVTCSLWQNAKHRVLVDGGTNRWLSFLHDLPDEGRELKNPDVVSGDFDSVNENTLEFFREKGATIEPTPNQDETDFTKAVRLLEPILEKKQITSIIAIQEHGDRFDHIMGNINTLYKANKFLKDTRSYLISEGSLTWLLAPGKHSIHVPMHLVDNQRWCSLVPISGKTIVTTKGLKWDLENGELEFGKLVSTSNTYASQNLEVTTNNYLLWSMGVFYFD
ncbi:unnamed protein product [Hermetia illucens]|uniref:Thiamin pyrophosphokinase thiamin-binding domain-containing protein n=1 Tax=Hermetia illucens TaxID=343691 RepID=A0A7R8V4R4_HERIL|nr:thiamin pyrophosphokinase 1 isoform X1 [Hermetia illucens]CAD7092130.1 unnamed protein product [Hermetia illucens]